MSVPPVSVRKTVEPDDTPGPVLELQPEKLIEEVPAGTDYKQLVNDQAFLAERVTIILQPIGSDDEEPAVPVSVQGDRVMLVPGRPTVVKRYHIAQLLKARPDFVSHSGGDVAMPEARHNRFTRQSMSRYNFEVVEDSPRGLAWLRELRRQYTRR